MNPFYVIAAAVVALTGTALIIGCAALLLGGMCAEAEREEQRKRIETPGCRPRVLRSPECKERP